MGSAAYILVARRSPEGGRGERTPTSVYAVTAGAMSLLIAFTLSLRFELAFFDHPYADTPGAITPSAMDLTLERMTQNPIGDLPLPVCPHRS